jgi:deoxyribodipyrimidine photolyase-related protein
MNDLVLIFPHQLFENNPAISNDRIIYLIEEFLFFNQYKFHKQKLVLHRASMKFYFEFLRNKNLNVHYIDATSELSDIRNLIPYLASKGVKNIHFVDVVDDWLEKRLRKSADTYGIHLVKYNSPNFLNSEIELRDYFSNKKKFSQTDFYIKQRKKLKILLDLNGLPVGGKWTFDYENRLKYPADKKSPDINFPAINKYYKEAIEYVEKNYSENYGEINIIYPTTFMESKNWLDEFIQKRLFDFGVYQDAIVSEENFLNHSVLSPVMNIGLLNPDYVIDRVLSKSHLFKIPLNSLEGFIRQIIGWREFIRGSYEFVGSIQRTKNYWQFTRKIPQKFWNASTGIEPIDNVITKVLKTGYCHHIERLMVIGNFMLLCEFNPDDVYKWFMELFIDAYDWVMVPNVYGMSQFADGGLISTKPYISGSNYLIKMSNYKKGDWQLIWDGLFWRFINKHRDYFTSNPRMKVLVNAFDNMSTERKNLLLNEANNYLKNLD